MMVSNEKKLIAIYCTFSFIIALATPFAWKLSMWIHLSFTIYNPTTHFLSMLFRVDTILYGVICAVIVGTAWYLFRFEDRLERTRLTSLAIFMVLYGVTLYGDSVVFLTTLPYDIMTFHEVHFFGIHLPINFYIYLSITTALIAIFFASAKYWWQVTLMGAYLWNLFLAITLIYTPFENLLLIEGYGGSVSIIGIMLNAIITGLIIYGSLYLRKREMENV